MSMMHWEKLKHLVRVISSDGEALVSHGSRRRGRFRQSSNVYCIYYRRRGHLKKDCEKLQAKGDLATNHRG